MPAKNYNRRPNFEGYRLTAEISIDAFSRVLLAERIASTTHEQPVVIKWLHSTPMSVQQDRDSLRREIHSLKSLHYPHILPILAAGFLEDDNTPYLVMEYAPNGSLADRLQHMQPLFHEDALEILDQVGQALHYAHQWNITHGNLKPQNILFDAAREALLTDFHLNSLPQRSVSASDETSVYTAPEQLTGRVDQQSDVYALGCLAYEMFTGHKPFVTPSTTRPGIYYRTRKPSAPRMFNPRLSQSIENAIMQAIAREPEQRQSDIPAFLAALREPHGIGEHKPAPTLPTLPIAMTKPAHKPANDTSTTQAQPATSNIEMPAPANTGTQADNTSLIEEPATPEQDEHKEKDYVLALTLSPNATNSGSVKQQVRHYLTVSVSILLTVASILVAYFSNQRASLKYRRFFLSTINIVKNIWHSSLNNIATSSWLHAIGTTTRHAWLKAINTITSSSWLLIAANTTRNTWLAIINNLTHSSWLHTTANTARNVWLSSLKSITSSSWFHTLSNAAKNVWARSTSRITSSTWFNTVNTIALNRLRLNRSSWAFPLTAALLLTAIIGLLALQIFSPHLPSGQSLTQATALVTLSPQAQGTSKFTLVPTLAPRPKPSATATTPALTLNLTPIPNSVPTTQAITVSSSATASSSNTSSSSTSSDISTSSATPTAQATTEATPTPVASTQPTPTPTPPTPTPTPIPPTPTPAPTGYCQVSYNVTSQWQGGFNVNMVVTNLSRAPINNWYLAFSFPDNQHITNGWNARFFQQGNRVIATAASYNSQITPGSSLSLGFQGFWFGSNDSPNSFTLNGVPCR